MEILVTCFKNGENLQRKVTIFNTVINIFAYCFSLVSSFSFFSFINNFVLKNIFSKCEWLKKLIFAESYINGIWIGWYIGYSEKKRYYIERIYQNIDGVLIKGIAFDADTLKENSKWTSTSLEIDTEKKWYFFSYDSQSSSGKENCNGCGKMDFFTTSNKKNPNEMTGYTIDIQLADKNRILSKEIKISDNTSEYNNEICLQKAVENFKNEK